MTVSNYGTMNRGERYIVVTNYNFAFQGTDVTIGERYPDRRVAWLCPDGSAEFSGPDEQMPAVVSFRLPDGVAELLVAALTKSDPATAQVNKALTDQLTKESARVDQLLSAFVENAAFVIESAVDRAPAT